MKPGRNDPCPCGSGLKYKRCCLPLVSQIPGPVMVARGSLRSVLGVQVWEPSRETQIEVREHVRRHLIFKYPPGAYCGGDTVIPILDHLFAEYDRLLKSELEQVLSWSTLDFVLDQLGSWTEVYLRARKIKRAFSEADESNTTIMRRALKHVAELMCKMCPRIEGTQLTDPGVLRRLERIFVAAKLMVQLAISRDLTLRVFPDSTVAEVLAPGSGDYLRLTVGPEQLAMQQRHKEAFTRQFSLANGKYSDAISEPDVSDLTKRLDSAFRQDLGVSPDQLLDAMKILASQIAPHWTARCPLVRRSHLIELIGRQLDLPRSAVETMLDIFTLSPRVLEREEPQVWRIKREDRISRKPLILLPRGDGDYLAWSPQMVLESMMNLFNDFPRRKMPQALSSRPTIGRLASELHEELNRSFEESVLQELRKRGFVGHSGVQVLVTGNGTKLRVSSDVGDIDVLCINPAERILLVGECKNVAFSPEPAQWYEDVQDFVLRRKSYREKFLRKLRWVKANASEIIKALCRELRQDHHGTWLLSPVMVTYYPTFASQVITEFPCVSIFILLDDLDREGRWPSQLRSYGQQIEIR